MTDNLETRYRKNLAKLKRVSSENGNKAKGKHTMKERKTKTEKMHRAPLPGFEPAPQLPPAQKLGRATTA